MKKDAIHHLLEKYCLDTLTSEEARTLSELIQQGHDDQIFDVFQDFIKNTSHEENSIDEQRVKNKIQAILSLDKQIKIKPKVAIIRSIKYSAVAAAAITLFLGVYLLFQYKSTTNNSKADITNAIDKDIAPGKNGAILVLSDGTEVLLDSLGNSDLIVNSDGTKIKVENGQVIYENQKSNKPPLTNTMITPKGRQFQLALSDGTKVWLNAASSITYPITFTKKHRTVSITGEAYFEVAKDPAKPFSVQIENSKSAIQVLGTHFNVNSYGDNGSYKTTLIEGSVKLNLDQESYLLKPGQQAISNAKSNKLDLIKTVDTEGELAWKQDLFYFNEAPIDDVMNELSRWYAIKVIFANKKPDGTFTGKIGKDLTLKQTLKILGSTRVKYKLEENNTLTIL